MVELLKQGQYAPLPVERQILGIHAGTTGQLDDLPVDAVLPFEEALYKLAEARHPAIFRELADKKALSDTLRTQMDTCIAECKTEFLATRKT
jgi:F-type H+-transporting ATPase subunit alpha